MISEFLSGFKSKSSISSSASSCWTDAIPDLTDPQEAYDHFAAGYDFSQLVCPFCGETGQFEILQHDYSRYFYNSPKHIDENRRLYVCVLKCACGHTHTLFPSWMCPFSSFSYPYIFTVIRFYFEESGQNKSVTARNFSMSYKQVKLLLTRYLEQYEEFCRSNEESASADSGCSRAALLCASVMAFWDFSERFIRLFSHPLLTPDVKDLKNRYRYLLIPRPAFSDG